MQNETLVETLRRSWLHFMDADAHNFVSTRKNADQQQMQVPEQHSLEQHSLEQHNLEQHNPEFSGQQPVVQDSVMQDYFGALGRVSRKLQHSMDETEMFQTVIQELVQVLNLSACQVRLYNADGSMVMARHEYLAGSDADPTPKIRRVDFPLEILEVSDVPSQFCHLPPSLNVAVLQYPLLDGSGVVGSMQLERSHQPACNDSVSFNDTELEFIQQVASQSAIALRRNRFAQINKTQTVELKHLNQLQDAFLGTVSYELRIPLANIRMAIQMITLALTKETNSSNDLVIADATLTKILRYLEVLQRECDRETKLIQDLLDLQQLDMDTLSLVMSAIDLEEWLPYVISPFQKRCQEYNLDLQTQLPQDLPAFMCDQITLSRIVSELVGNATKYTPAGGKVTVMMEPLYAEQTTSPKMLRILVCNTGVEIPIEEKGRIFEKFYRLPKLDIRKLGGTGLGLALVEKLVQRLDGTIELQTGKHQTCFVVELPFP